MPFPDGAAWDVMGAIIQSSSRVVHALESPWFLWSDHFWKCWDLQESDPQSTMSL